MVLSIHYKVSMPTPQTHYFYVEINVPSGRPTDTRGLRLVMPVWTPGAYTIRDFARNILEFKANDARTGHELPFHKDSKNSWIVETNELKSEVKISYRVYALEYKGQTSYLDNRHGIINGASLFMYVEGFQDQEHILTIVPYPEWKVISTSLDPIQNPKGEATPNSRSFSAQNFDILVDSPVEIGNQEVRSFEVEGIKHEVSMFGPKSIDVETFVSDLKRIVEAEWKIIGVIPYRRYVFLIDFGASRSGSLEHLSSTHCTASRLQLILPQEYRLHMELFAHELFHAWNIKRMRPKGLGPFNYSSESYTKSLWIAEGISSYYDDLILRRAGIFTTPDYLYTLSLNINEMKLLPGWKFESAEEASFDSWIKHYLPAENVSNTHCDYYTQGALLGWIIDMEIRRSTGSAKNLDYVMQRIYNETFVKENRGYTDEEFEKACNDVAGKSLSKEIFDVRVRGHEQIDFDRYLGYAGLSLGPKSKNGSPKGYLGIKMKSEGGKAFVESKLFDTPADKCGLAAGDEIIAMDNLRLDSSTLPFYISNRKPGDEVSLLISRDGFLETLSATVAEMPQIENRIYKKERASEQERLLFKNWMLEDWDNPLEYPDYTPSPVRTKPLDYL